MTVVLAIIVGITLIGLAVALLTLPAMWSRMEVLEDQVRDHERAIATSRHVPYKVTTGGKK